MLLFNCVYYVIIIAQLDQQRLRGRRRALALRGEPALPAGGARGALALKGVVIRSAVITIYIYIYIYIERERERLYNFLLL